MVPQYMVAGVETHNFKKTFHDVFTTRNVALIGA